MANCLQHCVRLGWDLNFKAILPTHDACALTVQFGHQGSYKSISIKKKLT